MPTVYHGGLAQMPIFHYDVKYMDYLAYFKGKRVTVMGLGLLGRGVGDALYLAEAGAIVTVTDLKSAEELAESVLLLAGYPNVTLVLGEHRTQDFVDRDLILVAAGVPFDSGYLVQARSAGVRLVQSAALFAELSGVPIIGVTGTRGKSTVTHMIHHVLSVTTGETVLLGGNIRGVSNLQLLKSVTAESLCVMELDSWQLQGFGWAGISPSVAVFTNFMEDHLNYYMTGGKTHGEAMKQYFTDKAQIFLHQEDSGVFITTPEVFEWIKSTIPRAALGQEVVLADVSVLPEDMLLATPGEHNRLNAALAYEALRAASLSDEEIFDGLASFPGVPGRLEYLGTFGAGVRVYNDNNATTPAAVIAGLRAVGDIEVERIILIAGGAYKAVDPTPLAEVIPQYCKQVILLSGTGTDMLKLLIAAVEVDSLAAAVEAAFAVSAPGDIILFSPGFASFGMFKNEYDRNDQFVALITALDV